MTGKVLIAALTIFASMLIAHSNGCWAQVEVDTSTASKDAASPENDPRKLDEFLTNLALESIPATYIDEKDWGKQSERWDGVKIRIENGRIKTKRRKKKVNHGTWNRYEAKLIDPENSFSVKLLNFKEIDQRRTSFDVVVSARTSLKARRSKWIKGMQIYSLSAEGWAAIELTVKVSLASTMDLSKLPPDIVFDPKVESATITIDDFRIDRVSKAGGELAQQITRAARKQLEKRIASREQKLVEKLKRKIDDNRDRFTISAHDAIKSKWASAAKQLRVNSDQDSPTDSQEVLVK